MYFYILDNHNVPPRDFERNFAELQSLLTEFKITGEIARVTPLRIIPDLVETATLRGAKTLVVCGTDETFNQVIAEIKDQGFTLAFIPFISGTQIGKVLGMDTVSSSIKTLASRRIEKIDLAQINGVVTTGIPGKATFISYLEFGIGQYAGKKMGLFSMLKLSTVSPVKIKVRIDDSYNAELETIGGLIINARAQECKNGEVGDPQDGFLDLIMLEKLTKLSIAMNRKEILSGCYEKIHGATIIKCKKIEFISETNQSIFFDGKEFAKNPSTIEVVPQRLRVIVGKNRTF